MGVALLAFVCTGPLRRVDRSSYQRIAAAGALVARAARDARRCARDDEGRAAQRLVRFLVEDYFTSDRSFADKPLDAALSTREWNARLDGNVLGYTWRVPMSAVFEALGRPPR